VLPGVCSAVLRFCDVFVPRAACRALLCPEPFVSSMLLSLCCLAVVSLSWLRVYLRVAIRILSCAFAKVVFSDAFDAEACFSLGRGAR